MSISPVAQGSSCPLNSPFSIVITFQTVFLFYPPQALAAAMNIQQKWPQIGLTLIKETDIKLDTLIFDLDLPLEYVLLPSLYFHSSKQMLLTGCVHTTQTYGEMENLGFLSNLGGWTPSWVGLTMPNIFGLGSP